MASARRNWRQTCHRHICKGFVCDVPSPNVQLGWLCVRHRAVARLQLRGQVCYLVGGLFWWVVCILVVHQSSISLHLVFGKGRCSICWRQRLIYVDLGRPARAIIGHGAASVRRRRQRGPRVEERMRAQAAQVSQQRVSAAERQLCFASGCREPGARVATWAGASGIARNARERY